MEDECDFLSGFCIVLFSSVTFIENQKEKAGVDCGVRLPCKDKPCLIRARNGNLLEENNVIQFDGVILRELINNNGLIVSELLLSPGVVVSMPQHAYEKVIYIVNGGLNFSYAGAVKALRAGECIRIPPGVLHNIICHDDARGRIISVWSTTGEDLMTNLLSVFSVG